MKRPMPTAEDWERLHAMPDTPLYISGVDMLCLLGFMQLGLRHPGIKGTAPEAVARVFAEELEKRIVEASPGMKDVAAAGWNPQMDVVRKL